MKMSEERTAKSKWFSSKANWYVLFVKTYEEQRIADRLQKKLDSEKYVVFVPTKDYAFKKQGTTIMRKVPWLNGYVFIASVEAADICMKMVEPLIVNESAIFRLLSNDNSPDSAMLSPQDREIMTDILDENFNIAAIKAEIVDDRIRINEELIAKNGGKILKVSKHKQTAIIEMALLGKKFDCEIALEF